MTHLPPPVDSVLQAIGRTPLVRLGRLVPADSAAVVAKLEYFNPTGSSTGLKYLAGDLYLSDQG